MIPKYALIEFERKFLVRDIPLATSQGPWITDLYIRVTRLRLRHMMFGEGHEVFKLGKKYGQIGRGQEAIVNAYLTREEYDVFRKLPGFTVGKKRGYLDGFSVDLFGNDLVLAEFEASSLEELESLKIPSWVGREVTGIKAYEGATIARRGCPSPRSQ